MRIFTTFIVMCFLSVQALAIGGIPVACRADVQNIHLKSFDGLIEQIVLRYQPEACAGMVDRNGSNSCSIFWKPAHCRQSPSTFAFQDPQGKVFDIVGEEALCNHIYQASNGEYPQVKYHCQFTRTVAIRSNWSTNSCQGGQNLISGSLVREPTESEIQKKKCEALTNCLQGDLPFFDRRAAKSWAKTLNCN